MTDHRSHDHHHHDDDEAALAPRLDRLEVGLVGLADATGQVVPAIEEIKAELPPVDPPVDPNVPTAEEFALFEAAVQGMLERGDVNPDTGQPFTHDEAATAFGQYLNDIKEGRRDENGNWIG